MDQISDIGKSMTPIDYLQLLSLSINDPSLTRRTDSVKETDTLDRLAKLGLREGTIFEPEEVSAEQKAAIEDGFTRARREAKDAFESSQVDMNGWRLQSSLFFDDLDYVAKAGADDVAWGTPSRTSRTRSPTSSTTARAVRSRASTTTRSPST